MAYGVPTLGPAETAQFTTQRNNARRTLQGGLAQNTYQQTLAGLQYKRQQDQMGTQWGRRRAQVPGQYIANGTFNSGLYQRALKDYAKDRTQSYGDAALAYQGNVGGLKLKARGLNDEYANTIATSMTAEQARRAQIASQLRSIL